MDYKEIETHVITSGFKRHYNVAIPGAAYSTDYISEGIFYALHRDPEFAQDTSDAARRFYAGDWGTMLSWNEENIPDHEFGEYPSKYGEIYIHREMGRTVMYFMFER